MTEAKRCPKCGETKSVDDFSRDRTTGDGRCTYCKECRLRHRQSPSGREANRIASRRWRSSAAGREKIREYRKTYRPTAEGLKKRALARKRYRSSPRGIEAMARRQRSTDRYKQLERWTIYRKTRHLPKQPCEVCGKETDVHAHHDDYGKPLEVRWLCRTHHLAAHREKRLAANNPPSALVVPVLDGQGDRTA